MKTVVERKLPRKHSSRIVDCMKSAEENERVIIEADDHNVSCIAMANVEFNQKME